MRYTGQHARTKEARRTACRSAGRAHAPADPGPRMRAVTDAHVQPANRDPGPPPPAPPPAPVPAPITSLSGGTPAPPYAAPYAQARHPQYTGALTSAVPPSRTLGVVALALVLTALIVPALAGGIAGYAVGAGAGSELAESPITSGWDWRMLSPVRDQVLLGEIAFWLGTLLGTWALVQGMVAVSRRRGRGYGIAAVVVAVLAPAVFAVLTWTALAAGVASGSSLGS